MFQSGGNLAPELLLIGGVVFQYIATRILVTVMGRGDGTAPGRLAIAQWLPIVATVLAAVIMHQPEMAVCLIFGSTVASLSLLMGMTTYVAPIAKLPAEKKLWPLVLPAALFLLLAGFHGSFTWYHALMLLLMGSVFLWVWIEPPSPGTDPSTTSTLPAPHTEVWLFMILAAVLAAIGAYLVVKGTLTTSARPLTPELLGATILSPLLMLPALGAGTMLAQRGHANSAVTSLCGTALLNLCLLLPIVILLDFALKAVAMKAIDGHPSALTFPLVTWRVDNVVLLLVGFSLIPIAAGRWVPQRIEAILLVILYAGYLVAETLLSVNILG